MDITIWLTFVATSIALLLIPGPTILLVLSYALSQGRSVALATAAGVALGDFIAMTVSLAGLGALVLASATVFTALKWVGAVYLVYLGIRLIRGASHSAPVELDTLTIPMPHRGIFFHAVMVTAFNPKSIAFFIAFVPQFIQSDSRFLPQFVILVTTFVSLAAINAFAYALLADQLRNQISRPSVLIWLTRLGGGALVAMGIATATFKRAST